MRSEIEEGIRKRVNSSLGRPMNREEWDKVAVKVAKYLGEHMEVGDPYNIRVVENEDGSFTASFQVPQSWVGEGE